MIRRLPGPTTALVSDPLGLDGWFAEMPVAQRPPRHAFYPLTAIARDDPQPAGPDEALAMLRDLDFLLCHAERTAPGEWRWIPGLEALLVRLGRAADHIPRGCNHTYGVINPPGERMRTFTGHDGERLLIEGLRTGGVGIERILTGLRVLACADWRTEAFEVAAAAGGLAQAWDPMVASAVRMRREMPFDVFSRDIIPWLAPLTINGTTYRAPTGAQFSNTIVDWIVWGVDLDNSTYRMYAEAFMLETPRTHRRLRDEALRGTGGRSLLAVLHERVAQAHPATAIVVLDGLEALLRRIRDFRAIHQRFANETLAMREADVGSGMQAAPQFEPLLVYTRRAREQVSQMRARIASPGTMPNATTGSPSTRDHPSSSRSRPAPSSSNSRQLTRRGRAG